MPDIYIIAGCNGSGKTTAAYNLLPDIFKTVEFINADEIARGLSPLNSLRLAIERVAVRVSKGGHNIPPEVIERRYFKGMKNFSRYAAQANDWYVYDNSGTEYVLVAKNVDNEEKIINFKLFKIISGKCVIARKGKTLAIK